VSENHIQMPVADRCAFCDYLAGRRQFTVLRRDSNTATLVTREQRGRGHVLVLPVRHRPTILDLTPREATAIMEQVVAAARAIDAAYGRPGISVWQNNGVPANQTIPHVHFHVAGTLPGGDTDRGHVEELALEATDKIAHLLELHL
jgi:histidine triad (HIT) family protein